MYKLKQNTKKISKVKLNDIISLIDIGMASALSIKFYHVNRYLKLFGFVLYLVYKYMISLCLAYLAEQLSPNQIVNCTCIKAVQIVISNF